MPRAPSPPALAELAVKTCLAHAAGSARLLATCADAVSDPIASGALRRAARAVADATESLALECRLSRTGVKAIDQGTDDNDELSLVERVMAGEADS